MYAHEIDDLSRREGPLVRWKNRVKKYRHERVADRVGVFKQARWECVIVWECLNKQGGSV